MTKDHKCYEWKEHGVDDKNNKGYLILIEKK